MKPSGDVLARNVALLLRRAYVPALPRPVFRDELRRSWLSEVQRELATTRNTDAADAQPRNPTPALRGPSESRSPRRRMALTVAASLLVAAGGALVWRSLSPSVEALRPAERDGSAGAVAELRTSPVRAPAGPADGAAVSGAEAISERVPVRTDATGPGEALAAILPEELGDAAIGEEQAGRGAIGGRLLGPDGQPLTSYRVALLLDSSAPGFFPARTLDVRSEDGTFLWGSVAPGRYGVFAGAEGLALASLGFFELGPDRPPTALEAQLEEGGTLHGYVVDPTTGLGIAGAWIVSERDTPQSILPMDFSGNELWVPASTRTHADGSFTLANLSPGPHVLRANAPGFAPSWTEPLTVVEAERTGEVLIELGPGGIVEGRVERADGSPWPHAPVLMTLMGISSHPQNNYTLTRTDPSGSFRIADLPALPLLAVLAEAGEGGPRVKPVQVAGGGTARVNFLGTSSGAKVRGRVRWSDGSPLVSRNLAIFDASEGAGRIRQSGFEATATDLEGRFLFEGIDPGRYSVYLVEEMGRWIRWIDLIDVGNAAESLHELVLSPGVIEGRVIDEASGEPQTDVTLLVERLADPSVVAVRGVAPQSFAGTAETDDAGRFRIEPLAPGRYVVSAHPAQASDPGNASRSLLGFGRSAEVTLDEATMTVEIELALQDGMLLTLYAEDERGEPVDDIEIALTDRTGFTAYFDSSSDRSSAPEGARTPLDPSGASRRHHLVLPPGLFQIAAFNEELRSDPHPIEMRPGAELRIVLSDRSSGLVPRGSSTGRDPEPMSSIPNPPHPQDPR